MFSIVRFYLTFCLLAASLSCLFVSPCQAQIISATAGFDGVTKSGVWTPVVVTLSNSSDKTIEGELYLSQSGYGRIRTASCRTRINLPPKSAKQYHVYGRLHEYGEVRLMLESSGRATVIRKVTLDIKDRESCVVVTLGDRTARLNFLAGESIPRKGIGRGGDISVGSISAKSLPDRPTAYDGIDLLVISDLPVASTDSKALQALSMWVASGGTMVVPTGSEYRKYMNPFFDELLPVRLTGVTTINETIDFSPLGVQQFPAQPMVVASSEIKPGIGSVLAGTAGVPIYAERQYGLGKVIFLAFDPQSPPFRNWDGQANFWKSLADQLRAKPMVTALGDMMSPYGPDYNQSGSTTMASVVEQDPRIKTPALATMSLFLLSYLLILVPVNYMVLNRMRRRELAWITTPVIVLVFTVAAYATGYTMKGNRLNVDHATIVEGTSHARYARVISETGIFSPASRTYQATSSDPFALVQVIETNDGTNRPKVYTGEQASINGLKMSMWSRKTVESLSGIDLGGCIEPDLTLSATRLTGSIRNGTNIDFKDCHIVMGSATKEIGRLKAGQSVKVDIDSVTDSVTTTAPAGMPRSMPGSRTTHTSSSYDDIGARLGAFATSTARSSHGPILVAAIDRKGHGMEIPGHHANAAASTYCVIELDYLVGKTFSLSPASIPGSIVDSSHSGRGYGDSESDSGPGVSVSLRPPSGGYAIISYQLPIPTDSAIISMKAVYSCHEGEMLAQLHNWKTGKWEKINLDSQINKPGNYVSAGNEVRMKVQAKSGNGYAAGRLGLWVEGRRK